MLYARSLEIEQRLEHVLRLIRTGRYSTPKLAEEVGVSIPTISRCVTALRARGYDIRAEKHHHCWRYFLMRQSKISTRNGAKKSPKPRDEQTNKSMMQVRVP